jgi:membrane fusion protein (multidrug efflux system)
VLQLGYINGEYAEVLGGIEAGDQVITQGRVAVRDGAEVEVLNPPAAAPAATAVADAANR